MPFEILWGQTASQFKAVLRLLYFVAVEGISLMREDISSKCSKLMFQHSLKMDYI